MVNLNPDSNRAIYEKAVRVIFSCVNESQLEVATSYMYAAGTAIDNEWYLDLIQMRNLKERELRGVGPLNKEEMSLLERAEWLCG